MTDEAIIELIGRIARFVCVARATITGRMKRDFYRGDEFIFNQPMIEEPDRLATILFNLARGHALIHGRNCLTWEDLSPVIEIALSSMPDDRRQVIQHMVSSKGGFTDAKKLEEALGVSRPTALDIMRLLDAIGLVSFAEGSGSKLSYTTLKDEFHWILTEEFRALRVPYFMKGQNAQHRGK